MNWMIAVLALIIGCTSPQMDGTAPVPRRVPSEASKDFHLQLSRKGCFGQCPQYDLTVSRDGGAVIVARRFMPFEGTATARLNPEYLRKLVQDAHFNSMQCVSVIPDADEIRLTVTDGTSRHSVECSLTGGETAPLTELVRKIHDAVLHASWGARS